VRRQKGENKTFVILKQDSLIMRNKNCQPLIKELKGLKLCRDLTWMGNVFMWTLGLMWQAQLIDNWGVNSNFFFISNNLLVN